MLLTKYLYSMKNNKKSTIHINEITIINISFKHITILTAFVNTTN